MSTEKIRFFIQSKGINKESPYDFSDLMGKLSWQGDALDRQKQLRNEWE